MIKEILSQSLPKTFYSETKNFLVLLLEGFGKTIDDNDYVNIGEISKARNPNYRTALINAENGNNLVVYGSELTIIGFNKYYHRYRDMRGTEKCIVQMFKNTGITIEFSRRYFLGHFDSEPFDSELTFDAGFEDFPDVFGSFDSELQPMYLAIKLSGSININTLNEEDHRNFVSMLLSIISFNLSNHVLINGIKYNNNFIYPNVDNISFYQQLYKKYLPQEN